MESFESTADVVIRDGLVCIVITAPGAPETIMRMPSGLAVEIANRILKLAYKAPASWPASAGKETT